MSAGKEYLLQPPEEERNFSKQFEGQEHNYGVAVEVIDKLIIEMKNAKISTLTLFGVKVQNFRIKLLRNFLISHLKIKGIEYDYHTRENIIKKKFYTVADLVALRKEATRLNSTII